MDDHHVFKQKNYEVDVGFLRSRVFFKLGQLNKESNTAVEPKELYIKKKKKRFCEFFFILPKPSTASIVSLY